MIGGQSHSQLGGLVSDRVGPKVLWPHELIAAERTCTATADRPLEAPSWLDHWERKLTDRAVATYPKFDLTGPSGVDPIQPEMLLRL